jgi:hypothetical protein
MGAGTSVRGPLVAVDADHLSPDGFGFAVFVAQLVYDHRNDHQNGRKSGKKDANAQQNALKIHGCTSCLFSCAMVVNKLLSF